MGSFITLAAADGTQVPAYVAQPAAPAKAAVVVIQEIFGVNNKVAITDPVYPVYLDTNIMAGRTGEFADGFFGNSQYEKFDAVIAAYHDQGLIPFKTIAFGQGVNFTAGLEKVRTSPDHGTAYEIAGKGVADENSMKQAIYTAIQIYRNRKDYNHYGKNPLKKASR